MVMFLGVCSGPVMISSRVPLLVLERETMYTPKHVPEENSVFMYYITDNHSDDVFLCIHVYMCTCVQCTIIHTLVGYNSG